MNGLPAPVPPEMTLAHMAEWPMCLANGEPQPNSECSAAVARWAFRARRYNGKHVAGKPVIVCEGWVAAILRFRPSDTGLTVYHLDRVVYCPHEGFVLYAIARLEAIVEYVGAQVLEDTFHVLGMEGLQQVVMAADPVVRPKVAAAFADPKVG